MAQFQVVQGHVPEEQRGWEVVNPVIGSIPSMEAELSEQEGSSTRRGVGVTKTE